MHAESHANRIRVHFLCHIWFCHSHFASHISHNSQRRVGTAEIEPTILLRNHPCMYESIVTRSLVMSNQLCTISCVLYLHARPTVVGICEEDSALLRHAKSQILRGNQCARALMHTYLVRTQQGCMCVRESDVCVCVDVFIIVNLHSPNTMIAVLEQADAKIMQSVQFCKEFISIVINLRHAYCMQILF